MTDPISRRQLAIFAASGLAAGSLITATSAEAYQGNMERALSDLFDALASLRESSSNKGGHRVKAIQLVQQAIQETQAGIEYADEHGGGGRNESRRDNDHARQAQPCDSSPTFKSLKQ